MRTMMPDELRPGDELPVAAEGGGVMQVLVVMSVRPKGNFTTIRFTEGVVLLADRRLAIVVL
jgi:hypothetical protein